MFILKVIVNMVKNLVEKLRTRILSFFSISIKIGITEFIFGTDSKSLSCDKIPNIATLYYTP